MSLFKSVIISACSLANPAHEDACIVSLEAAARQNGIEQNINALEKKEISIAKTDFSNMVGSQGIYLVGTSVFVANIVKQKGLSFKLPTLGVCDEVSNRVGIKSYGLIMKWNID